MIYELQDVSMVEHLFKEWDVLDVVDVEIKAFVTDPDAPRSALLYSSVDGIFLAGEPDRELVEYRALGDEAVHPQNAAWEQLIRTCYPEAVPTTRYAIHRCKDFDRDKLQSFVDALPEGYEIRRIDSELYDRILAADDDDLDYLTGDFETKEAFLEKGRGFVVLKDGSVVAGASSEYCYRCGIEVEIDTVWSERRKGLASAVGAKLILSCMDDGLEPVWDAANKISVHLAEKLGYRFDHEYVYYWINEAQALMLKDPDKSKWQGFCGDYEPLCEAFQLKKVWMQNGDLYGRACNEPGGDDFTFKLLPIGENTFGRANGSVKITFGDDCLVIDDITCKKIKHNKQTEGTMETITLRPITEENREAVLALRVRDDQPFVAPNHVSLRQADKQNAEAPGTARPFAIYADEKLVGFCMFAFDPENEDEEDRYWLWRFMIDQNEQGKGYGQAALQEIIRYFKKNDADRLYLSTEPENARGLHIYHKAGFKETGLIFDDEATLMQMLKGPKKIDRTYYAIDVPKRLGIRGKKDCGVSMAVAEEDCFSTYCMGSGRCGEDFPVNPDMLFQAGSVSKPAFAATLLRFVDKGKIDLDADISGVVPEFVKKGPLTFAALLSHTAGFNVHGFPGYPAKHNPLSLEDVLNGKGNTPKVKRIKPYGQEHMYSGGGITLAQLAFERITGVTLRDAFQKEVAEPLGMKRSGFFQPLDEELVANAAFGGRLAYKEDAAHGYHYYPEHAAAGLWTTPTDLTKLGIALSRSYRKGGFLKKKTARRMLTPVKDHYGLCMYNLRGDVGEHGGWNEGFLTEWMFSLNKDLCVASMHNRSNDAVDWAQTYAALDLFQTVEAEFYEDLSKRGWKSYCGKYEQNVEDFRVDEVFMEDETLFARVITEEEPKTYELYPIGKKTFGRKGGFAKIEFCDGCLIIDGVTCRKLS